MPMGTPDHSGIITVWTTWGGHLKTGSIIWEIQSYIKETEIDFNSNN